MRPGVLYECGLSGQQLRRLRRQRAEPGRRRGRASKVTTSGTSVKTSTASATATANSANLAWCNANVTDAALRGLVYQGVSDNVINRNEMLGIFTQVGRDGMVSANEFNDLKRLVGKDSFFTGYGYVDVLASDVILGNAANATYQGSTLGNLTAGSSSAQLDKLVGKWFLGTDHPAVGSGISYVRASGSLFPHAPVYADVRQGLVGDCYFLASLGEAALVNPQLITSMFIVNGDGTYTVRFYNRGNADYVTVDSMLPVDRYGNYVYDNFGLNVSNKTAPLWAALAEKAYAQINASGWLRVSLGDRGSNSYDAISGGYMYEALSQITGKSATYAAVNSTTFVAAFNSGKLITFGSFSKPVDTSVVGSHAYAVVGYNKSAGTVTLFNPWGINNGYAPGLVTLNWTQMKRDFSAMQFTV